MDESEVQSPRSKVKAGAVGLKTGLKIVLVLLALLVNLTTTMKRIFALIVLLGIVMSAVLTGCNQSSDSTTKPMDTNAPVTPSMPSTNK